MKDKYAVLQEMENMNEKGIVLYVYKNCLNGYNKIERIFVKNRGV